MLTKEQKKQVAYNDLMISTYKSEEQKRAIEKAQSEKARDNYYKLLEKAKNKNQERVIRINHLYTSLKVSEITPEIEEKEEEL
ncbi:MAG: hypothetical protein GY932_15295 [Arcobacter sp.]|nr:hypothetical protein [Arcobacter sp.]